MPDPIQMNQVGSKKLNKEIEGGRVTYGK